MDASERLIKASKSGNIKEVRKLLSRGALFTKDEFGNTALHEAAWSGNNDIVKILLKAYCFVDSVNAVGFTPLHLASQNGHAKVAKTLLKWKANPSLKNQHEENPIHLVAKYDHAHLVPVFAAAKVDLDIKAKDDNTALHIAAKLGNTASVKALIQNGANPNIANQKSRLPLDYAEICKCPAAVKLLSPFTERPVAVGGVVRTSTELELSKDAKGRRSFFKARSSKSQKDTKTKSSPKQDVPVFPVVSSNGVQMRQRSNTVTGTTATYNSKRYSREFEDVSPLLFSSSSTGSVQSRRSNRSKTRSPSLEELIEEVERESHGPNYRYVPPPTSDSDNDTGSVSCQLISRLSSSGSTSPNNNYNFFKSPKLAPTQREQSPLLKSPQLSKDPLSDLLSPGGFLKPKEALGNGREKQDDDYVCLRPTSEIHTRAKQIARNDKNTRSVPLLSEEVLNHTYEYLPPLPGKKEEDGFESYIEMSPRVAVTPKKKLPSSPLKFSPVRKVAVIPDSPNEKPYTRHEPIEDIETTPKSILTQFEGDKRDSQIDKYLQDELETIRQAFQIRLTQMEKRYKRHLDSVTSVHRTTSYNTTTTPDPTTPITPTTTTASIPNGPLPENDTFSRRHNRRASWHGKMKKEDANNPPQGLAYSIGCDSGSEESLASSVADSSCCDNTFDEKTENRTSGYEQEFDDDDSALSVDMKAIIQERVQQYKSQMMDQWMREAEEKIALMEQDYMKKISSRQLHHLSPSSTSVGGVKSLDCSETFV